jgi:hypothetical protein
MLCRENVPTTGYFQRGLFSLAEGGFPAVAAAATPGATIAPPWDETALLFDLVQHVADLGGQFIEAEGLDDQLHAFIEAAVMDD